MAGTVEFGVAFRVAFAARDTGVRKAIAAYAVAIASEGPAFGRPMADTLKASKHATMKELRPTVNKVEWRVAYAFDTARKAIALAAVTKGGRSSTRVYKQIDRQGGCALCSPSGRCRRAKPCSRLARPAEGSPGRD